MEPVLASYSLACSPRNLLIAQLNQAYQVVYEDMQGFARMLPSCPRWFRCCTNVFKRDGMCWTLEHLHDVRELSFAGLYRPTACSNKG